MKGLSLTGAFNKKASKANNDAASEYDCLWNETFILYSIQGLHNDMFLI